MIETTDVHGTADDAIKELEQIAMDTETKWCELKVGNRTIQYDWDEDYSRMGKSEEVKE